MISTEQWRATVGCFHPTHRKKVFYLGLRPNFPFRLVIIVVLFNALIQCGDIESNPGPPKLTRANSNSKQGTLPFVSPSPTQTPSSQLTQQPSITDLLNIMNARFDQLGTDLGRKIDEINNSIGHLAVRIESLESESSSLKQDLDRAMDKIDKLENQSRRDNLIFHGIEKTRADENWADCERSVKQVIGERLGIEGAIEIERAHRLPSARAPQPIIVKFRSYQERTRILKERSKLKNSNIYIVEDFSQRVRDIRKQLYPFVKKYKEEKRTVSMVFDHIVLDGQKLFWDSVSNQPKPKQSAYTPTFSEVVRSSPSKQYASPNACMNTMFNDANRPR